MRLQIIALFIVLCLSFKLNNTCKAQNSYSPIGINLARIEDWATHLAFVDVFIAQSIVSK